METWIKEWVQGRAPGGGARGARSPSLLALALIASCAGGANAADRPPPGSLSCSGCHTADPKGAAAVIPRIDRLEAPAIVAQLKAFKAGQRPATVMDRIARGLTDAEIEAIAAWLPKRK